MFVLVCFWKRERKKNPVLSMLWICQIFVLISSYTTASFYLNDLYFSVKDSLFPFLFGRFVSETPLPTHLYCQWNFLPQVSQAVSQSERERERKRARASNRVYWIEHFDDNSIECKTNSYSALTFVLCPNMNELAHT